MTSVAEWFSDRVRLRYQLVTKMSEEERHPAQINGPQPSELKAMDPSSRDPDGARQLGLAEARLGSQLSGLAPQLTPHVVRLLDAGRAQPFSRRHAGESARSRLTGRLPRGYRTASNRQPIPMSLAWGELRTSVPRYAPGHVWARRGLSCSRHGAPGVFRGPVAPLTVPGRRSDAHSHPRRCNERTDTGARFQAAGRRTYRWAAPRIPG